MHDCSQEKKLDYPSGVTLGKGFGLLTRAVPPTCCGAYTEVAQFDESIALLDERRQDLRQGLRRIGIWPVHMGKQDVSPFDPSHPDNDGRFVQGCSIVDIERETRHLEAHIGDHRERVGIVLCCGGPIPTGRHPRDLFHRFGAAGDLGLEMRDIRVTENPVDTPVRPDNCRHMPRAVVLDLEQIGMRFDECHAGRVVIQPTPGRKDGGRDATIYQHLKEITIEAATARIQRQRYHVVRPRRWEIEHLVHLHRPLSCTHFQGKALQQ